MLNKMINKTFMLVKCCFQEAVQKFKNGFIGQIIVYNLMDLISKGKHHF